MTPFTEEDVEACWEYSTEYLVQILNHQYSVESARADLESLIGSKWDDRTQLKALGEEITGEGC